MRRLPYAVVAAALVVLAPGCTDDHKAAATAASATTSSSRSSATPSSTSTPMTTTTSTAPSSTTTSAPARSFLNITLDPQVSGHDVVLGVIVDGLVPQLVGQRDGQLVPGTNQELHYRFDFGDGTGPAGGDAGDVACRSGTSLVPMHYEFPPGTVTTPSSGEGQIQITHTYERPGTYTITYTSTVCELGDVSRTATITIS